jgi:hypothetical protein
MRGFDNDARQHARQADVSVDAMPENVHVPQVARRLRCSQCGGKTISTRPAWHTSHRPGTPDFRPHEEQ